ncbi:MAG TPA: DUF512 domain-containing protein, partial [Firmicutes bacterium]|nr:DUF512 domain-containing protein [Bacillota bacterium]
THGTLPNRHGSGRGPYGDEILIPRVMLRSGDDTFLDDVTVDDIRREAGVPVRVVDPDGDAFARAVLDPDNSCR